MDPKLWARYWLAFKQQNYTLDSHNNALRCMYAGKSSGSFIITGQRVAVSVFLNVLLLLSTPKYGSNPGI